MLIAIELFGERWIVEQAEASADVAGHGDGDSVVQSDDGGVVYREQAPIEQFDLFPIRIGCDHRLVV